MHRDEWTATWECLEWGCLRKVKSVAAAVRCVIKDLAAQQVFGVSVKVQAGKVTPTQDFQFAFRDSWLWPAYERMVELGAVQGNWASGSIFEAFRTDGRSLNTTARIKIIDGDALHTVREWATFDGEKHVVYIRVVPVAVACQEYQLAGKEDEADAHAAAWSKDAQLLTRYQSALGARPGDTLRRQMDSRGERQRRGIARRTKREIAQYRTMTTAMENPTGPEHESQEAYLNMRREMCQEGYSPQPGKTAREGVDSERSVTARTAYQDSRRVRERKLDGIVDLTHDRISAAESAAGRAGQLQHSVDDEAHQEIARADQQSVQEGHDTAAAAYVSNSEESEQATDDELATEGGTAIGRVGEKRSPTSHAPNTDHDGTAGVKQAGGTRDAPSTTSTEGTAVGQGTLYQRVMATDGNTARAARLCRQLEQTAARVRSTRQPAPTATAAPQCKHNCCIRAPPRRRPAQTGQHRTVNVSEWEETCVPCAIVAECEGHHMGCAADVVACIACSLAPGEGPYGEVSVNEDNNEDDAAGEPSTSDRYDRIDETSHGDRTERTDDTGEADGGARSGAISELCREVRHGQKRAAARSSTGTKRVRNDDEAQPVPPQQGGDDKGSNEDESRVKTNHDEAFEDLDSVLRAFGGKTENEQAADSAEAITEAIPALSPQEQETVQHAMKSALVQPEAHMRMSWVEEHAVGAGLTTRADVYNHRQREAAHALRAHTDDADAEAAPPSPPPPPVSEQEAERNITANTRRAQALADEITGAAASTDPRCMHSEGWHATGHMTGTEVCLGNERCACCRSKQRASIGTCVVCDHLLFTAEVIGMVTAPGGAGASAIQRTTVPSKQRCTNCKALVPSGTGLNAGAKRACSKACFHATEQRTLNESQNKGAETRRQRILRAIPRTLSRNCAVFLKQEVC